MKRRLFSIILVLILCLTMTPVSVLAEGESGGQEPGEKPGPFTVMFDLNDGQADYPGIRLDNPVITSPSTVEKGNRIAKPSYPRDGQLDDSETYRFQYWATYDSKTGYTRWDFDKDTVDDDITLYAVWQSKYNKVHEKISTSGKPYTGGKVEYRDASGNVKYTLKEGTSDEKYTDYSNDKIETGSYYLYIDDIRIDREIGVGEGSEPVNTTELFHVNYDSNGQEFTDATKPEDILCYTTGLTANNKITKPATTPQAKNSSYVFAGWTTGSEVDSEGYDFSKKITADTTIYAQWIKADDADSVIVTAEKITGNIKIKASATRDYHVNLQQEGNGSVTTSSELAVEGEKVMLTATPDTGYVFKGWKVVSPDYLTIDTENSFTMPNKDVTVKAIFEPQIYSGTCGENLTWTLNAGTGLLSIEGTGDMTSAPWLDNYTNLIKTVKIGEGVTSLWYDGNRWIGAFAYCGNLTSVELPSSMTTLGNFSFRQCYNLKSITIPEGMAILGNYAFMHCTGLQSITLPDTLQQIDGSVFYNCTALGNVYFNGTQQQWDGINKDGLDGENKALRDAYLHILRHTVTYDANGGENAPDPQIKNTGEPLTLSSKIPVREGYTFFGWSRNSDVVGADYQPGDKFELDQDTTLYAVWREGIYKIEASPQTLTFDSRLEGYTSLPEAQTVTVTNNGNKTSVLQQPTAQNYELGQLSQPTLEPGETATFTVQPKSGLEAGTYEEPITITTTDGIRSTVTVKFTVEKPPVTPGQPGDKPGEKPGKPGTSGTPGQTPAGTQGAASLTGSSALQNPEQAAAQTGDESNMVLWITVLLLGAAGAAGSMLWRKKIQ